VYKEVNMQLSEKVFYPHARIAFLQEGRRLGVQIDTERLRIRSYRDADFESCAELYGDKAITKYFDYGGPRSQKEVELIVREKTEGFLVGEPFGLFSIFRKEDEAFIGQLDFIPHEPGIIEIGFILHRGYQGQGFGTEAVLAFLGDYVDELGRIGFRENKSFVRKIIASVHPSNYESIRLLQRVGMTLDKFEERFGAPRLWYSYDPKHAKGIAMGSP
jgi:RimJ/RimL family protein N-acetyltransferase